MRSVLQVESTGFDNGLDIELKKKELAKTRPLFLAWVGRRGFAVVCVAPPELMLKVNGHCDHIGK